MSDKWDITISQNSDADINTALPKVLNRITQYLILSGDSKFRQATTMYGVQNTVFTHVHACDGDSWLGGCS